MERAQLTSLNIFWLARDLFQVYLHIRIILCRSLFCVYMINMEGHFTTE